MPKISFAAHISPARGYRTLIQETPTSRSAAITGATRPAARRPDGNAPMPEVRRSNMVSSYVPHRGRHPRAPEALA